MRKNRAWGSAMAGGVLAVGFASMLGGCGWIGPGEYKMFKMQITEEALSSGCFYPDSANPNKESDSDTALQNAIWVVTVDTADNVFLDIGPHTLKGAETDDGYKFSEKQVDVTYDGNDAKKTKRTGTVATSISFTIDGKSIGGTANILESYECVGSTCTPADQRPDCTHTIKFSGTSVDDVQLQYNVK